MMVGMVCLGVDIMPTPLLDLGSDYVLKACKFESNTEVYDLGKCHREDSVKLRKWCRSIHYEGRVNVTSFHLCPPLELNATTMLKINPKTLMLATGTSRTKFPSMGTSQLKETWTMGTFVGVGLLMWVMMAMDGSMRFWKESTGGICSNYC